MKDGEESSHPETVYNHFHIKFLLQWAEETLSKKNMGVSCSLGSWLESFKGLLSEPFVSGFHFSAVNAALL